MKNKPTVLILVIAMLFFAGFTFNACKSNKNLKTADINQLLNRLNDAVTAQNSDSVLNLFEADKKNPGVLKLVDLLIGKSEMNSKNKPLAKITLNVDAAQINQVDNQPVTVNLPVNFLYDNLSAAKSVLYLKIQRNTNNQLKIFQVNAKAFLTDFISYENFIRSRTVKDEDIYSPITLKSFEVAKSLKTRYDSVVWFSHIKDQTYYYVVKGKWDSYGYGDKDSTITYKMGLLGPDLKEIIAPGYDLIHNIGGTFANLIEVDKKHKRGFYNLSGKLVVPVIYDAIFPVKDEENLAALQIGKDFYWLRNDLTISDKTDLKISTVLAKLAHPGSFTMPDIDPENITEMNSRDEHGSVYVPPSYLVDLNLMPAIKYFKNPLRKAEFMDISTSYVVKEKEKTADPGNWLNLFFIKSETTI